MTRLAALDTVLDELKHHSESFIQAWLREPQAALGGLSPRAALSAGRWSDVMTQARMTSAGEPARLAEPPAAGTYHRAVAPRATQAATQPVAKRADDRPGARFADEDEVYRLFGRLWHDLVEDDARFAEVQRANTIVQFVLRRPQAAITLRLRSGEEGRVDLGPTELVPEVVMAMDADTAHRLWLGKHLDAPWVLLTRGQIKAKGPIGKILRVLPLLFPAHRARLDQAPAGPAPTTRA
ncbi:MAG: hypothetical protein ACR2KV_04150 [Solirubrobacteraceae bacterium]